MLFNKLILKEIAVLARFRYNDRHRRLAERFPQWRDEAKLLVYSVQVECNRGERSDKDMRTSRTNFDRQEARRDRRYAQPLLTVAIDGQDYASDNWSLGGFQLTAKLPVEPGTLVSGILRIAGADGFPFNAAVVRRDEAAGVIAFRFHNLSPLAVGKLDRALARRLVRRR